MTLFRERVGPLLLWQWLGLLGVVAVVLRLVVVVRYSMWLDDGATLEAIRLGYPELLAERLRMGHFPWFFVAFKMWTALAGESHLALRLPSLLACLGCLPVVAALAGRIAGGRGALAAGVLFVVHGSLLRHAAELRMYSWMALLGGILVLALVQLLERPTAARAAAVGLAHLALLQLHASTPFFTVPAFLAFGVVAAVGHAPRRCWMMLAAALVLPLLATVPVLWAIASAVEQGEVAKFRDPSPVRLLFRAFYELTMGLGSSPKGWEYGLGLLLPAAAVAMAWRGDSGSGVASSPRSLALVYTVCGLSAPLIAWLLTAAGVPVFGEPRYYIAGTVPLLALVGGAIGLVRWREGTGRRVLAVGFLVILGVSAEKMWDRTRRVLTTRGMGLNTMAGEILREVPPGSLVAISDARQVPTIAHYYFGKDAPFEFVTVSRELDEEGMRAVLAPLVDPSGDLVLYLYRENSGRLEAVAERDFGPWEEVRRSDDDQPCWVWLRRESGRAPR